jgi:hypothetical protein
MSSIEHHNAGTILPLRWLFAYILDSSGNLIKCKACVVIRGDLQPTHRYTHRKMKRQQLLLLPMPFPLSWH